jgi:hypothetical protein
VVGGGVEADVRTHRWGSLLKVRMRTRREGSVFAYVLNGRPL